MRTTSRLLQSWHRLATAKSATLGPGGAIPHEKSSAWQEQDLLIDKTAVRTALVRMVVTLEENCHTREDLLQEALVSFWSSERQYPGQRRSWYLQSVRFHLHHIRASGRSLDSPKHRGAQAIVADNGAGRDEWLDTLDSDQGIMSEVQARDIFSVLVDRLKPIDQVILGELAEGRGVCDIAEKLNVSHVFVVQHRRRIARAAISLGISPVAAYPIRRASSKKSNPAET